MENIIWTDRVRIKEVLLRVEEERNILYRIKIMIIGLVIFCVGTVF